MHTFAMAGGGWGETEPKIRKPGARGGKGMGGNSESPRHPKELARQEIWPVGISDSVWKDNLRGLTCDPPSEPLAGKKKKRRRGESRKKTLLYFMYRVTSVRGEPSGESPGTGVGTQKTNNKKAKPYSM